MSANRLLPLAFLLSFAPARAAETNLIANPDLTVSSGAAPAGWVSGSFGDNDSTFLFVPSGADDGAGALRVRTTRWKDGDAKWNFRPVPVAAGRVYRFRDAYKATAVTATIAEYRDAKGVRHWQRLGFNPKSAAWKKSEYVFPVPDFAVDMTVLHVLAAVGVLRTSHFELAETSPAAFKRGLVTIMFDDGYKSVREVARPVLKKDGFKATLFIVTGAIGRSDMFDHPVMTDAEIAELAADGDEIESHTKTHPRLSRLPPARLEAELADSKSYLEKSYAPVDSVALPYGDYDATVIAAVRRHYAYCRTSDLGENARYDFDPYRIRTRHGLAATTVDDVRSWLARAKKDKSWLAILYHNVGDAKGDEYTVTAEAFAAQMAAVKESGLPVVTMRAALSELRPQLAPPAP